MTQTPKGTTEPWPAERLREARGILADMAHHTDTRLVLAARVVIAHSPDDAECKDASALRRILDARASGTVDCQGGAT